MRLILREMERVEQDPRSGSSYYQIVDVLVEFYEGNTVKVAEFKMDDHSWRSFRAYEPTLTIERRRMIDGGSS